MHLFGDDCGDDCAAGTVSLLWKQDAGAGGPARLAWDGSLQSEACFTADSQKTSPKKNDEMMVVEIKKSLNFLSAEIITIAVQQKNVDLKGEIQTLKKQNLEKDKKISSLENGVNDGRHTVSISELITCCITFLLPSDRARLAVFLCLHCLC